MYGIDLHPNPDPGCENGGFFIFIPLKTCVQLLRQLTQLKLNPSRMRTLKQLIQLRGLPHVCRSSGSSPSSPHMAAPIRYRTGECMRHGTAVPSSWPLDPPPQTPPPLPRDRCALRVLGLNPQGTPVSGHRHHHHHRSLHLILKHMLESICS